IGLAARTYVLAAPVVSSNTLCAVYRSRSIAMAGLHTCMCRGAGRGRTDGAANFARTTSRVAAVLASAQIRALAHCISPDMGRLHTFVVTLRRESRDTNWGLRLVGGADLATPLIVTRVTPGTPAGRDLLRGDIIAKIDDYDARDLRHEDAQNLFRNASNNIKLVVQRSPSPLPAAAWRGPESLPRSTPVPHYSPFPVQHEGEYRSMLLSPSSTRTDDTVDESIQSQPYRTTPLVLPGAKVRREPGPTESYLRHHPNPAMRAPPHHDYRDTLMKQKVAESVLQRVVGDEGNKMVHKQFNSPINLYSDQNIANSIRQQSSPLPANGHYGRPHVVKRQVFY
ncbi:hypothetical protein ACJJTC_019665, partial [Scirpophaga incertulas]